MKEFPDFEYLKSLAETDPDKLEAIRKEHIDHLIKRAPKRYHRTLKGLQFRLSMISRRSSSPVNSCVIMSRMMLDSFFELNDRLNKPPEENNEKTEQLEQVNNLIPFPVR